MKPAIHLQPLEERKVKANQQDSDSSSSYKGPMFRKMRSDVGVSKSAGLHPNLLRRDSFGKSERSATVFDTNIALLGNQVGLNKGKKTLAISLDETLVHCKFDSVPADEEFSFTHQDQYYKVSLFKRPYLQEFLEKMSKIYEIIFFTSSVPKYANNVVNLIDPKKLAAGRLYRDACLQKDGIYIKNYGKIGRKPESLVILDNLPTSYCYNITNAIPIKSWFPNNTEDTELLELVPILESLSKVKDVRSVITKIIEKMADNYSVMNKMIYEEYQNHKNIDPKQRRTYAKIVGNYYKDASAYNPINLIEKYPNETDMFVNNTTSKFTK